MPRAGQAGGIQLEMGRGPMRLVEERSSGAWLFYVAMVLIFLFFLVASELRFPDDRIWPWSLLLGVVHVVMVVLGLVRFVAARRRENRVD